MIYAYFNYPNPHVTIHKDAACGNIQQHKRPQQRSFHVDIDTLSSMLRKFANKEEQFTAQAGLNDMWLVVDFNDEAFETAVVLHIKELLGNSYRPFKSAPVNTHCNP